MECECEKSELDESFLVDQDSKHSNWVSRDVEHMEEIINPCSISPETSKKYMVFEEQLDLLISTCHTCGKKQEKLSKYESGSCVTYSYTCQCGEDFKWNSQPFSGSLPYGNLLLAASILFSGGGPTASLNVFKHLNMACISQRSYFRLQQAYMVPCIRDYYFSKHIIFWKKFGKKVVWFELRRMAGVVLLGTQPSMALKACWIWTLKR